MDGDKMKLPLVLHQKKNVAVWVRVSSTQKSMAWPQKHR